METKDERHEDKALKVSERIWRCPVCDCVLAWDQRCPTHGTTATDLALKDRLTAADKSETGINE